MLSRAAPAAQIVSASGAEQLLILATEKDHELVAKTLEQLKEVLPGPDAPQLKAYDRPADISLATNMLSRAAPAAQIVSASEAEQLLILATEKDHELVAKTLEQLKEVLPGPDAPRLEAYDPPGDVSLATTMLSRLVPTAQIVSAAGAEQLLVLATDKDHRLVTETLQRLAELPAANDRRRLKIYPVAPAQRTRFLAVLETLRAEMADLKVITDATPGELSIWARPSQHDVVEQLLAELAQESPDGPQYVLRVFPLEHADVTAAQSALSTILPGTQLIPETARRRLLAWAAPETHEKIAQALREIDVAPQGRSETLEVHRVPRSDLSTLVRAIQPLAPEARLAADFGSGTLLIWATTGEHERLRAAVENVVQAARGGTRQVRRFELQRVTPNAAVSVVQSLVRRAIASPGADGNSIIVWAEPEDLETVASALRELDSRNGEGAVARQLVAYPLPNSKLEAFMRLAEPDMVRRMQLTADTRHRSLLARGTPQEHAELKQLLDEFVQQLPEAQRMTAVVYPLQNGDVRAAYRALSTIVPNARLSIDDVGNQLLATTHEEEHEVIRTLIEQMEQDPAVSNRAVLRSHLVQSGNPNSVYTALLELFRRQRDVNISLDQSSGTLLAYATPQQHEQIEQFLQELQQNGAAAQQARAQLYPLGEADGTEIVTTLNTLFANQAGRVRVSHDRSGNQLIVVAPPEQQAVVRDLMQQLPRQQRIVEAITLARVDVQSASQAISRLFSHLNYSQTPTVDTDVGSQQLFIRGTAEQIEQIRELLGKMGEPSGGVAGLPFPASGPTSGNGLRVVPFRGDTREAIEQLRRVWPRLRANDLQILEPEDLLPGGGRPTGARPDAPGDGDAASLGPLDRRLEVAEPVSTGSSEHAGSARSGRLDFRGEDDHELAPGRAGVESASRADWRWVSAESPAAAQPEVPAVAAPEPDNAPAAAPVPSATPSEARQTPEREGQPQQAPGEPAGPATPEPTSPTDRVPSLDPPVILVPGEGSITIASDDPEAAEQAEAILRALAGESGQESRVAKVGNQLMFYPLKHAGAEGAAESISQLVRGLGSRGGRGFFSSAGPFSGNVVAVADPRLNAVVVYANRADQPLVEGLLEVLDAPESPETLAAHRPKLIPLKFAKVERVENVVRAVYRSQMQSGAGRRPITIPPGISADLAAALQQANAARSGPLLTVSSDPVSNTLIVMAPQSLVEEVEQLVAELDDADRNDPARSLQVLELEKVNSERIRDALDILLDGGGRGRTSRFRRR
jgi:type II secretory pathway component GspD/PulD (secretin)